jgi:hypothetical protein
MEELSNHVTVSSNRRVLNRTQTLVIGARYSLQTYETRTGKKILHFVYCVAYANCPAMVIVQDPGGKIYQCCRDDLFEPET